MMHIEAKTFTSAAEQLAHAKAVRDRLFPARKLVNYVPVVAPVEPEPILYAEPQQEADTYIDPTIELRSIADICTSLQTTATFSLHDDAVYELECRLVGGIPRPTISSIETSVLRQHPGVTRAMLRHATRKREIVIAKHHVWWRIRQLRPDLSLPQIGRLYGGMDHTTILHGINKTEARMAGKAYDPKTRRCHD